MMYAMRNVQRRQKDADAAANDRLLTNVDRMLIGVVRAGENIVDEADRTRQQTHASSHECDPTGGSDSERDVYGPGTVMNAIPAQHDAHTGIPVTPRPSQVQGQHPLSCRSPCRDAVRCHVRRLQHGSFD
jgi:hypothetical protein